MTTQANKNTTNLTSIPFALTVLVISAFAFYFAVSYESQRFYDKQLSLAKSSIRGVQYNLSQYIQNKQDIVQSIIEYDRQLLRNLVESPDDQDKLTYFKTIIQNRLKSSYSFSIADKNGNIIIKKQNASPGQRCKTGLKFYSENPEHLDKTIIIHGNSAKSYHIDIMARIDAHRRSPILFVSFKVNSLIDLLKNAQTPGQKLFIVKQETPESIEISDSGIKGLYLSEKNLSKATLDSVLFQQTLHNTGWTALAIPEQLLLADYNTLLIKRALIAYFCLILIVSFFVWRLLYEEKTRRVAEENLNLSYKLLNSEVKLQTQELTESKQYLEHLFMSAPYGLIVSDEKGIINSINKQAEKIFGYTKDELINQPIEVLIPLDKRANHTQHHMNFINNPKHQEMGIDRNLMGLRKNQCTFPVTIALNTITYNKKLMIIASINDITELVSIQQQLLEEHERAIVTLSSIGDGVITTSVDGIIKSLNPMAEKLTGWSSSKAIGEHISFIYKTIDEKTRNTHDDPIIRCLKKNKNSNSLPNNSTVLIHKNGFDIPIEDNVSSIRNRDGVFIGIVLVFHDVSLSRQYAHEIEYQANHDALTGLLNRRKFDNHLTNALINARETQSHYVLLYMDLDRFKLVNDTAGHAAGDELLKKLTRALAKTLRQRDTFSRLGGDEFGILLEHCSSQDGLLIANKILETVSDFRFFWKDDVFNVGISIGMIAFTATEDSADKLLSEADAACYTAKENGRNRIQVYDEHAARKLNESHIINMLSVAFENNQMRLYQQKITSVKDKQGRGHYEILIRMLSNDSIVPPGMFLPAAERCGLAITLDRWVIRSVFKWLSENQSRFTLVPVMAINLSGQSITDSLFSNFVQEQFLQFKIDPSDICFEITETAAMYNLDHAKEFIHELKEMGCQFSLDDFGSGHASYAQLKHLPVDYLKIDGSLVKDILDDPIDFSIVKSINDIGHILGMKTIAEFVENTEIAEKLTDINVDFLQGYGIARPAPINELISQDHEE